MPDAKFYLISVLSSLVFYIRGHQASHVMAISVGQAELNPALLKAMVSSYSFAFRWFGLFPILFLVWYGYKTEWWYAVGAFVLSFIIRLALTKIEIASGLVRSAWIISLSGIVILPVVIIALYAVVTAA